MTHLKRFLPALSLFVLCVFFAIKSPAFLTVDNFFNLAGQYAYLLIIAMGATLIIVAGGIDLSAGSVLAASGCMAAYVMVRMGASPIVGVLVGILTGAVAGAVNGLLITRLKVPAFIATLGMLLIARGVALKVAGGVTIDGIPTAFNNIANYRFFGSTTPGGFVGIPAPLLLIIAAAGLVAFLFHYTKFGRYVYAIGSNPEAARVSGVNVEGVTLLTYIIGGALTGVAALVESGRLGSGNPTGGANYELDVVTACVVGGASLAGGEGRVSGTILGALLIAVLRNGANLLSVPPFDQNLYIGLLIIGAVALDQRLRRLR
jgi:ribose transport system permease protein